MEILPDPWGGLVYRHRGAGVDIISSDLGAVAGAARAAGVELRRSLEFVTELAAGGNGGLTPASYEGVETLEMFQFVRVRDEGVQVREYAAGSAVLEPFASYEEGLAATAAEVEDNLRAVVAGPHGASDQLAHLTGGLDTRLVLAACLKLGITDQFRYLSMGPATQPDRAVAEQLAVEHDLTMTDWRGTHGTRSPATITEQAAWPMDHSHGMVTAGPHEHFVGSDTVVLAGGFGGVLKGNYSTFVGEDLDRAPTLEATAGMAERIWGALAYSPDPSRGLYTREVRARRVERLHDLRMAAEARGLSTESALDWIFIQLRNRYFALETTRVWGSLVHRFEPLYTLSGPRLALSLPTQVRQGSTIGLDLLHHWAPGLRELPFDKPRVTRGYQELRGPVPERAFARPEVRPRHDGRRAVEPPGGRVDRSAETPEMRARAKSMLAPLWQVRDLDPARAALRTVVADLDPTVRDGVFNRSRLHALLHKDLKHRVIIRQVHNLQSALQWLAPPESARPGHAKVT